VLVFSAGGTAFSQRAGRSAGFLLALYGPLFFIEGELLGEGWGVFWAAALLALFARLGSSRALLLYGALGCAGALAALTRPPLVVFFLAGCLAHFARSFATTSRRDLLVRWGVVGAALLAIWLPAARLNARATGHWGIFPSSGGINLYIGNNPRWQETVVMRPGIPWLDLLSLPDKEGIFDPWERSAYFSRRVGAYLRESPGLFIEGLALKTVRFVNSRELPRNIDVYAFREWSSLLALLTWKVAGFGFPFGVLLPLAAVGLWAHRRNTPDAVWLLLTTYPAVIVLYFVSSRYRLPVLPALAVAAGAGVVHLRELARARQVRPLAYCFGAVALGMALLSVPGSFPEERVNYRSELYRTLGYLRLQQRDYAGSAAFYQQALAADPRNADALVDSSIAMAELNRNDEARQYIARAIALRPELPGLRFNQGLIFLRLGRAPDAERSFRETMRLDPSFRGANANLGVALQLQQRPAEAIAAFRREVALNPGNAQARALLEQALRETAPAGFR
jgi:4-amino-4-deoxy-L-arabinose transferase-like glycosyltransferase